MVRLDEAFGDRETQARSVARRAGAVGPERDVEDVRQIGFGHAAAGVAHLDVDVFRLEAVDAGLDDHAAVARRVPDRVLEQVAQHAQDLGRGRHELGRRSDHPALELDALRGGDRRGSGERVGHEIAERDALELESEHPGLGSAQLEQVIDERGESIDLFAKRSAVAGDRGRVVDDAIVDRFDDRAHAGERCAQVVRDPSDELPPRRFERSLPNAGGVEPLLHHVELVRELRELLRRASARRLLRSVGLIADAPRDIDERAARGAELAAHDERGGDADGSRGEEHHGENAEVVARDEHRARCGERAGHERRGRRQRQGRDLVSDRPGAQRVQHERARAEADECHTGGDAAQLRRISRGHRRHRGREERERPTNDDGRDR